MQFDQMQFLMDKQVLNDYVARGLKTNENSLRQIKSAVFFALETQLTERQRQALTKYYLEQKKLREIAEEMGVNISTVSRHIKGGKKKIKNVVNINCRYLN